MMTAVALQKISQNRTNENIFLYSAIELLFPGTKKHSGMWRKKPKSILEVTPDSCVGAELAGVRQEEISGVPGPPHRIGPYRTSVSLESNPRRPCWLAGRKTSQGRDRKNNCLAPVSLVHLFFSFDLYLFSLTSKYVSVNVAREPPPRSLPHAMYLTVLSLDFARGN